jgi:type I restriction enzyme S subunit
MTDWREVTIAEVGKIYDGPHATPERVTEGPYFLNIASLNNGRLNLESSDHISTEQFGQWTRRVTPSAGDLLFSYETRLGEAALMPPNVEACLGRRMALLRPNTQVVDPRFLLYLYLSPATQRTIERNTIHGATVNRIALSTMGTWRVHLPPLPMQSAIGRLLGVLDDKIALLQRTECTIDELISSHYNWANKAPNSHSIHFFDAFTVQFGEPFQGAAFAAPGEGRPLIRIRDLKTFKSQVWTSERRTGETVVQPGDILVGMDAEFRATAWLGQPGVMNQRVCRITSKIGGAAFVREALKQPLNFIEGYKSATTVIHLNKSDLTTQTVTIPSPVALQTFERIAEPLLDKRVACAAEREILAPLRDTLLPALMSGRLCVRDAEKMVEDAT